MWRADPKEYEEEVFATKLKWTEYPGNEKDVCALAVKVACGKALKDILSEIAHDLLDDKIKEKLEPVPELLKKPAEKGAEKLIDKAVEKGVDKGLKILNEKIEKELGGSGTEEGKESALLVKVKFSEGVEKKTNDAFNKHKKNK